MPVSVLLDRRFAKFLVVGVLNTAFGYSIYAALIYLGLHVSVAILIGTILGILFNFRTTGQLVFGSRDNRLFVRFVAVYAILYVLNVAGVEALLLAGVGKYLAGALMLVPMALLAFILNKTLVFDAGR